MKITTFNPQIITKDAEPVVRFFEELGFAKRHDQEGIGEMNVEGIRMKDLNGFYLDISQADIPIPHDMVAIRMNVDDFDEAYKLLESHGCCSFYGGKTADTKSSRSAMMIASSSGYAFNLVQHIKK